jgi:hypothetical protein
MLSLPQSIVYKKNNKLHRAVHIIVLCLCPKIQNSIKAYFFAIYCANFFKTGGFYATYSWKSEWRTIYVAAGPLLNCATKFNLLAIPEPFFGLRFNEMFGTAQWMLDLFYPWLEGFCFLKVQWLEETRTCCLEII